MDSDALEGGPSTPLPATSIPGATGMNASASAGAKAMGAVMTGGTAGRPAGATMTTTTTATPGAGGAGMSAAGAAGAGGAQASALGAAGKTGASAMMSAAGNAAAASAGSNAAAAGGGGMSAVGAMMSAAGKSSAAGVTLESSTPLRRPCVSDGNEVVFIGDSYSDYPVAHQSLASFLEKLAIKDGALMQGDSYRNLAEAGTTLAAPPAGIQTQWQNATAMKPIKVVVMTGGGNDVLINNQQCRAEGSEMRADCMQVVRDSLDAAAALFSSMEETGVSDVLYFWYPHIPGGLLTGYERGTSISDYTYPMLESLAKAASTAIFHVHIVPTVAVFEGHPEYFYSDGLHANDLGESKIADAIWSVMTQNCIGQASGSACCAP